MVKPELTAIPVKRPEKFEFIRVHPDPEYRCGPVSFITIGRSEFYIVPPAFRKSLKPREYWIGQIFLAVNRLEKPFLWMVKLQSPTGRISDWYTSEMECAERAMRDWHPTKMPASTPSFLQKTSSKNRYGQLNRSQNY